MNPTALEEIFSEAQPRESASMINESDFEEEEDDSGFGVFSIDDPEDLISGVEYDSPGLQPMIKLKTEQGEAILRLSKIVSIESGRPYHTLFTIDGTIEKLNHRAHSLSKVHELLERESCFFKMKQAIVNCSYIEKIFSTSGVWKIKMETGNHIHLPDEQHERLMEHLQERFPGKIINE